MLFVERLGLFHCLGKQEGFLFSWRQCCVRVLGMRILGWGWQIPPAPRVLWCLLMVWPPSPSPFPGLFGAVTIELHEWGIQGYTFAQLVYRGSVFCWQGHFCLGNFPGESENIHICPGYLVAQLELLGSVIWTDLGKCQAFPSCACLWFQPTSVHACGSNQQASDFLLEGFSCKLFPPTGLSMWGWDQTRERGEMPAVGTYWV